jgi:hypothetical protein
MSNCQFEYNVAYTRGAVYYDQFSPEGPCNTKVVASVYNENKASVGTLAQESQQTSRDKAAYR